jgi:hypothetical protein
LPTLVFKATANHLRSHGVALAADAPAPRDNLAAPSQFPKNTRFPLCFVKYDKLSDLVFGYGVDLAATAPALRDSLAAPSQFPKNARFSLCFVKYDKLSDLIFG